MYGFIWKLLHVRFTLVLILDTTNSGICLHVTPAIVLFHCSVLEILGHDPKVLCSGNVAIIDFIHPEDQVMMRQRPVMGCARKRRESKNYSLQGYAL